MKTLFILVICLFSLSLSAENQAFLKSFQQTVKLNAVRFQDVNLVYPGDTIMVVKDKIIPIAILPKDSMPGYNDCMWYAVRRAFNNDSNIKNQVKIDTKEKLINNFNLSDFINKYLAEIIVSLLAAMFLLLLALLIIVALRRPIIINNNLSYTYPSANRTEN